MSKVTSIWPYKFILKNKYGFTQEEIELYTSLNDGILEGIDNKFISQAKYDSLRKYLDPASWRSVVHNKWITANYFNSETIKQPATYGFMHYRYGRTSDGRSLASAEDLEVLVEEKELNSFVFKHIGGGIGNLVFIIKRIEKVDDRLIYHTVDNKKLNRKSIEELLRNVSGRLEGYIVQEKLRLHPFLNKIINGGMSSIRFYTFHSNSGLCKSHAAFIRLGSQNKATDHAVNGGIMAPIVLETGIIQKGICLKKSNDWLSLYPETNARFEGLKIPNWESIVHLALKSAEYCPGLNWIGWDIILTPQGPYLIEGNVGDRDFASTQQLFGGFLSNGIFDDWMNGLELPEYEKNIHNELNHWIKKYLLEGLKKLRRNYIYRPIQKL